MKSILHRKVSDFSKQNFSSISLLLNQHKTPLHVLFPQIFQSNIEDFNAVFNKYKLNGKVYFAAKANKSLSFLQVVASQWAGAEVCSPYEMAAALAQGVTGDKIILSGPAKSMQTLWLGVKHQCLISIDDVSELKMLQQVIESQPGYLETKVSVLLRINDVSPLVSRFGIEKKDLADFAHFIDNKKIDITGFSFHINNYDLRSRFEAIATLVPLLGEFKKRGHSANQIDIGGGIPISYVTESEWKNFQEQLQEKKEKFFWADKKLSSFYPYYNANPKELFLEKLLLSRLSNGLSLHQYLNSNEIEILIEPGRSLCDQAGVTLMEVQYVKELAGGNLVVLNGNINHLSEQWFNSDYLVDPLLIPHHTSKKIQKYSASIAGNLCLENDMIAWRKISFPQKPLPGDVLLFPNTAGYQMDSNESEFHRIPIPKKISAYLSNKYWSICNDEDYVAHCFKKEFLYARV